MTGMTRAGGEPLTHEMGKDYKAEQPPFREIIPLWQSVVLLFHAGEDNKEDSDIKSQHVHFNVRLTN